MSQADLGFTSRYFTKFAWREVRALGPATLVWAAAAMAAAAAVAVFPVAVQHDLGDTFGAGTGLLIFAATLTGIGASTSALLLVCTRGRRTATARWALALLACVMLAVAWTTAASLLAVLFAVAGGAASVAAAVATPAVADAYPPVARPLAMGTLRAGELTGLAAVFLAQTIATLAFDLTWRALAVGAALLAAGAATGVRGPEPAAGRWDEEQLRARIATVAIDGRGGGNRLTPGESIRRVLDIATARHLLIANAAFGVLALPTLVYSRYNLDEAHGLSRGWAALALGVALLAAAGGTRLGAEIVGDDIVQTPGVAMRIAAGCTLCCGAILIAAAFVPTAAGEAAVLAVAGALIGTARTIADAIAMSVVPATLRREMAALNIAAFAGAGSLAVPLLLTGMDRRFGPEGALVTAALFAAQAAAALRTAARTTSADLDRRAVAVTEDAELTVTRNGGGHVPLLTCRGINFSYGQLQVLFDVDFTVDSGEMVALLGTNGAGKSTLLRLISGLALPSGGSIRLDGADITYLDAERRMRLGISQVPGGRGVYPHLSVVENLRVIGFTAGRDGRRLDTGIDAVFAGFPALAQRRNQPAATLSGGEQQMLSLARALILQPRLLLIDELSLGLAPKIVGELLEFVRTINASGTAIVLVEQSVNVALSLVNHAYFMEKGAVRFDGRATDLLDRADLLRSVFLEGAAAAVGVR